VQTVATWWARELCGMAVTTGAAGLQHLSPVEILKRFCIHDDMKRFASFNIKSKSVNEIGL